MDLYSVFLRIWTEIFCTASVTLKLLLCRQYHNYLFIFQSFLTWQEYIVDCLGHRYMMQVQFIFVVRYLIDFL